MRARRSTRIAALVGALALSVSACSGDDGDNEDAAPDLPENLAEACPAVGEIVSPAEDPGETDYTRLAADLRDFVDNADDETADALTPLADAAEARAEAAASVDESDVNEFAEDPSNFPTDMVPGQEYTFEGPPIEGDSAALEAADEEWINALETVSATCDAEGTPLYSVEPTPGLTEEPSQPADTESTVG
ncbi:hypothetical protein [Nocardioides zeae]|uniref:Secreted protein n=1 Tax=Nocardioides zeae TaxID=1457234 RepID=A0A6P0HMI9_9ACTN|nr:hypothetical protein [Nocardioides zeae]NEN79929.1 hypothetical protein [Nocardioides zeae]